MNLLKALGGVALLSLVLYLFFVLVFSKDGALSKMDKQIEKTVVYSISKEEKIEDIKLEKITQSGIFGLEDYEYKANILTENGTIVEDGYYTIEYVKTKEKEKKFYIIEKEDSFIDKYIVTIPEEELKEFSNYYAESYGETLELSEKAEEVLQKAKEKKE